MIIKYSRKFLKQLSRLPRHIRIKTQQKQELFEADPFFPTLKTHKLSGELEARYAFWINYKYRIIFMFSDKNEIIFLAIGTHEIY